MCSVCGAINGHLPGCPEAPEPIAEVVGYCEVCDEPVYEGEDCYKDDYGRYYHEDCLKNNMMEVLEMTLGVKSCTA